MLGIAACEKPRIDHTPTPEEPAVVLTKVQVGDFIYADLEDRLSVYDYVGYATALSVPAEVTLPADGETPARTLPVTEIGAYAFEHCTSLVLVTLKFSLT